MSESAARSGRGAAAEADYRALVERAQADPSVVGVVVFGSRAAGPFVTDRSDVDAFVIVAGSPADAQRWSTPHGSTAFALEGRVRPFNKWLEFEIEAEPLASSDLAGVVEFVREIAADPRPDRLRAAFRAIELAARAAGHGAVIDSWEPDVPWLRDVRPPSV